MLWHTECVMRRMFRSWSLAVQILVIERLEARREELKSQTGNRPTTLATMRKHQLVEAAVKELLWSRDRAETRDGGTALIGSAGTPTKGGRTSARKIPSRRDQGIGKGTEHPNFWGQRQAPGQGGVDSGPAAMVRETERNGNGAVRCVCVVPVGRDGPVGTEQSEFPETLTGSDGRGHLLDSDGSKTLTTIFAVLGSWRTGNVPPNLVSDVGTRREVPSARGRNNRHRTERQASSRTAHGIWTKGGRALPANFWQ